MVHSCDTRGGGARRVLHAPVVVRVSDEELGFVNRKAVGAAQLAVASPLRADRADRLEAARVEGSDVVARGVGDIEDVTTDGDTWKGDRVVSLLVYSYAVLRKAISESYLLPSSPVGEESSPSAVVYSYAVRSTT